MTEISHDQPLKLHDHPRIGTDSTPASVSVIRGHRSRFRHATRTKTWWRQLGVVALGAAVVAGCSSSPSTTAGQGASGGPATSASTTAAQAAAAHGAEKAIGDVPWAQVGPGWTLAMWTLAVFHGPGVSPAPGEPTPATSATTLYLVDPAGTRYAITTFPPPGQSASLELVDWSGDGSHALFYKPGSGTSTPSTFISIDLHTAAQTTFTVNGFSVGARYTRPEGKAILLSTSFSGNTPGTLKRVDLSGNPQLSYPTDQLGGAGQFSGNYLSTPDGTQLVLGTANLGNQIVPRSDNALVVVGNDGVVARALPTPMSGAMCSPVRWWTPTVILASCREVKSSSSQLWQVPMAGGTPTAITAVNTGKDGPDYGDADAWQLPSGTFLQSEGACGAEFLSRLTPDMHTTLVTVPGLDNGEEVAGVAGDKLVLLAKVGCNPTTSLLTYDPAANTTTTLLGPPVNGGGVVRALLYRGRE